MAKNLSVPLAFACLLHLANEKVSAACTREGDLVGAAGESRSEGAGVVLNLRCVGWFFFFNARSSESEGKNLALSNFAFLLCSQNLKLEGTEDLSDVLVKQGN